VIDRRQQRWAGVADRLIARYRDRPQPTGRRRTVLLIAAAVLFLVAMVLALRSLPDGELTVRWPLVVVTGLVGAPALLGMNAVEYGLSARLLGQRVERRDAVAVAVYGGAANLLPIPGTALVRLQALTRQGSGVGRAAGATVVVAVAWFGAAGLVGAPAAAAGGTWWLAAVLLGGGLVTVPVVHQSVVRLQRRAVGTADDDRWSTAPTPRLVAELYGLEVAMIVVRALRFWLVILAFDLDASVLTAFVLPVAGVLASALGFLPGGLGVREVLAGLLSGANGDPAAVGVLASGLDRIVALPVLAALALALAAWERRHPAAVAPAGAEAES
jgi:uncharacterized membrane protein YbhN (UPF0104 family)